jgi:hypothetical protein
MGAAIPVLIQYGIPLAAYAVGHLFGWIHHEIADARAEKRKQDAMHKALQKPAGE